MRCSKEICSKGSRERERETAEHKQSEAGPAGGAPRTFPGVGAGAPSGRARAPQTHPCTWPGLLHGWDHGASRQRDLILVCLDGGTMLAGRADTPGTWFCWIETRYVAYFGDGYVMVSRELSSHRVSNTFLSWHPTSSRVWVRHLEEICISVREVEAGTGQECENPWAQ